MAKVPKVPKIPPSEVFTRVFDDSPEFSESESDGENRFVIAKAIEKAITTQPSPPVTSKPSDQEINQESTSPPREIAESVKEFLTIALSALISMNKSVKIRKKYVSIQDTNVSI